MDELIKEHPDALISYDGVMGTGVYTYFCDGLFASTPDIEELKEVVRTYYAEEICLH